MTRSRGGLVLLLASVACRSEPAPVEPPATSAAAASASASATTVSGNGTTEAPFVIPATGSVRIPVRASREAPGGFRLAERADVVLTFQGESFSYKDPSGVTASCSRSPCVIPSAMAGAYRLDSKPGRTIGVEVLAPRAREPFVKSGKMTLTPKTIEGDPRGNVAEAIVDVPAPGAKFTLRVRPVLEGKPKKKLNLPQLSAAAGMRVYGPQQSVMMSMYAHESPGWLAVHFDAEPGSYVLRFAPKPLDDIQVKAVELDVEKIEAVPPDNERTNRPLKPGLDLPKLAIGDKREIEAHPEPERAETWVVVEPASEVAWSWSMPEAEVGMSPTPWDWCFGSPCFAVGVRGPVALSTRPLETQDAVDVEVRRLPTPQPTTLEPNRGLDVLTARQAPDDPRGAFQDFAIEVKADDTFIMTAKVKGDFTSPPIKEVLELAPRLQVVSGEELLELLSAQPSTEEQLRAGVDYLRLQAKKSGRVVVRLDGVGRAPARNGGVLLEPTKRVVEPEIPPDIAIPDAQ